YKAHMHVDVLMHETRPLYEVRPDTLDLAMIAVGPAGAVIERRVPEHPGARATRVPRPRPDELRLREPDLPPHGAQVRAQDAIVRGAVEAVRVDEAGRRTCVEVAAQPHEVIDRVMAGRRLLPIIHGPQIGDVRAPDLPREL